MYTIYSKLASPRFLHKADANNNIVEIFFFNFVENKKSSKISEDKIKLNSREKFKKNVVNFKRNTIFFPIYLRSSMNHCNSLCLTPMASMGRLAVTHSRAMSRTCWPKSICLNPLITIQLKTRGGERFRRAQSVDRCGWSNIRKSGGGCHAKMLLQE